MGIRDGVLETGRKRRKENTKEIVTETEQQTRQTEKETRRCSDREIVRNMQK